MPKHLKLALIFVLALPRPARAGDLTPLVTWSHEGIPKPIHREPDPKDNKIVHALYNLWQEDLKAYADLFPDKGVCTKDSQCPDGYDCEKGRCRGASMICGPTSVTNALLFQRNRHQPPYPKIFDNLKPGFTNVDAVHKMFELAQAMRADNAAEREKAKEGGTSTGDLGLGWARELLRSGYKVKVQKHYSPEAHGIQVTNARIGCLDIQHEGNLTKMVQHACQGQETCSFKAPTPTEYTKAGVKAASRTFCTQAMEINYHCGDLQKSEVEFVAGDAWGNPPALLKCPAPTLETLRNEVKAGRVPVLLFGWYHHKDGSQKIVRGGGHFVALAGHSLEKRDTFYVTNPLIDYSKKDHTYSKIVLDWKTHELDTSDAKTRAQARPTMLYTDDLYGDGGNFALLEDVIIVSPE